MKIESLRHAFNSYRDETKSESGKNPTKYRYPKNLRNKAIKYYESHPEVGAQELATMLGISSTSRDRWFGNVNRQEQIRKESPEDAFIEMVSGADHPSAKEDPEPESQPDIRIRCIDITVPGGADPDRIMAVMRSLIREAN